MHQITSRPAAFRADRGAAGRPLFLLRAPAPDGLRRLRGFAPVLMMLMAGCAAVGPNYVPPRPELPAAWAQGGAVSPAVPGASAVAGGAGVAAAAAVHPSGLRAWWSLFRDPLLDALVDETLARSPDLRVAAARLEQARAQRGIAQAGFLPSASARAGTRESAARGGDSTASYSLGVDASWEIDLFGGLRRALEAADADLQASAASLGSVQVSLAAEAALAYLEVRLLQARLDVAARNLASQEETLQLTDWRAQAGLVGSLDVEQARAGVEQVRAQLPALRSALGQARHRLSVLTGQQPAALDDRLSAVAPIPAAPVAAALSIPAEVLAQRPDVHAAERALAAETARVGQAEAARYPGLSLGGSIGLEALTLGGLTAGGATVRSIAASLAATVFDGGRLRRQVEIRSAVQAQALASYEATVLAALEEVENALLAVRSARERQTALAAAAEAARNAALLARQRYASGLIDFQAVLDSARTVLSAEDSLVSGEAEAATSMVRLYKALGGGWTAAQQ
ncbi:efflux transporter outer membrane subunit [Quisquiliibacterium transsilvanicum]